MSYKNELISDINKYILDFCRKYLNSEYYTACMKLLEYFVSDNIIEFHKNKIKKWAGVIIFMILSYNDFPDDINIDEINNFFNFSSIDVRNEAYLLIKRYHKHDFIINPSASNNKIYKNPPLLNVEIFPEIKSIKYIQQSNNINYIDYYYRKYHFGNSNINPEYNDFCESIRMLKDNSEYHINLFYKLLKDVFIGNFTIITVPSHNPNNSNPGIKNLAKLLIRNNNTILDGTNYLLRTKEVYNHDMQQYRSFDDHLDSMTLKDSISIKDSVILLMDDIYTSGQTIEAAKTVISQGKPRHIEIFVLGKTFYKNQN